MQPHLYIVPLELREANELVARWHRHHKPVVGHRFSIGVVDEKGELHGAAIVGRPVARMTDHRTIVEVTRLVTDGTPNACSALYGAAARAARALGYRKIQTFILETETGVTLRAAGWQDEGTRKTSPWRHKEDTPPPSLWPELDRPARLNDHPLCAKQLWSKDL